MSKVVGENLKKGSMYRFVVRGVKEFVGTFINSRGNTLVIKADEGINEIPKGDVYFYFGVEGN